MTPIILHIETATKTCSVALSSGNDLLALKESNDSEYSHSEKLNLFIESALKEANVGMKDLSAVAVSKGPGSFTGLRIGVSSAKGIAYALSLPLISCNTLDCLADGFIQRSDLGETDLIIPMIDARRQEVYMRIVDIKMNRLTEIEAKVIDKDFFSDYFQPGRKIHLIGDGAKKFQALFDGQTNIIIHDDLMPSAAYMMAAATDSFKENNFEDLAYFEPFYLKDFIAIKPRKLF
jgi:tRNA threonylcarbamoyladenosine biosynthesis protein TsaB